MDRFRGKGRGSTDDPNGMVHEGTSIIVSLPRELGRVDGYTLRLHALRSESLKKTLRISHRRYLHDRYRRGSYDVEEDFCLRCTMATSPCMASFDGQDRTS
jgi:hypothetical protein